MDFVYGSPNTFLSPSSAHALGEVLFAPPLPLEYRVSKDKNSTESQRTYSPPIWLVIIFGTEYASHLAGEYEPWNRRSFRLKF